MGKYRACANKGCRRKAIDALVPDPHEYIEGKYITLFGWTLLLYKSGQDYQTDICLDCSIDQTHQPYEEAYDAGFEVGFERGTREH
jgi:hypothetical protein